MYRQHWFALGLYTVLALVLTHPLAFNLTAAVPNDIGDPLLNTWILAWVRHALLTDPAHLFHANIFYPLPDTLAYSEHLFSTALLSLPVAEPVLAYNLSLLATFPLGAYGMYLLVLHWTHHRAAAFTKYRAAALIAGLAFGFAPYRFGAIAHLQLLTFHWLPFAVLMLDKLLTDTKPRNGGRLAAGLLIFGVMQALASWYLAIYAALILAIYGLVLMWRSNLERLALLAVTAVTALVMILPFAWPYVGLLGELRESRPLELALSLAASPADFGAAPGFNRVFGPLSESLRERPGFTEEHTLFLGVVAPVLALVALIVWRRRPRVIALVIILAGCLVLTFAGPYGLLASLVPPSTIVRVPARWVIPAVFALAALAGFGVAALRWRWARLLVLPLGALLIVEAYSSPLPLAPVDTPAPAYEWLAAQPDNLALVALPMHSAPAPEFPEVKRLYASTRGWWHLVNGYSGYTPPRQRELAAALAAFPNPPAMTALQDLAAFEADSLYVLVHPGEAPMDRSIWETQTRWQAERNPRLWPIGDFAGDYLYRVQDPPPDSNLATFGDVTRLRHVSLHLDDSPPRVAFYWQAESAIEADYTVFVHLRAADGFVRHQADGPPANGTYPTSMWSPGEIVQDIRTLPSTNFDHLAVGWYLPATGERLPALTPDGASLADAAFVVP